MWLVVMLAVVESTVVGFLASVLTLSTKTPKIRPERCLLSVASNN